MLSPEVKNALILIIAVSIALKVVTPTLVGNGSMATQDSYLHTQYNSFKPLQRDIADTSYSGHLQGKPISYNNPFPGLFPESYRGDTQPLYPDRPIELQTCGLCTCFTESSGYTTESTTASSKTPLNQYSGTATEKECVSLCEDGGLRFISFSEKTQVTCGYISTR